MNRKKRKPLDDALASDFVYGTEEPADKVIEEEEIEQQPVPSKQVKSVSPTTKKENKELSLMDKLQVQPKEATKRFTVDLEESLHRDLSILAAETGRTKADIVRILLRDAVASIRKSRS